MDNASAVEGSSTSNSNNNSREFQQPTKTAPTTMAQPPKPPSFFAAAPAPFSNTHPHHQHHQAQQSHPPLAPPMAAPLDVTHNNHQQRNHNNGRSPFPPHPITMQQQKQQQHQQRQDPQVEYPHQQQRTLSLGRKMALNRNETVFVSSAGDVVVCRCRNSTYHPVLHQEIPERKEEGLSKAVTACQKEMAVVCCEVDDLSLTAQDQTNNANGFCGNWGSAATTAPAASSTSPKSSSSSTQQPSSTNLSQSIPLTRSGSRSSVGRSRSPLRGGLLGGAPAQIEPAPTPPLHPDSITTHKINSPNNTSMMNGASGSGVMGGGVKDRAQKAFQSDPISPMANGFDDESIVPIRSFDYSQYSAASDENPFHPKLSPKSTSLHRHRIHHSKNNSNGSMNTSSHVWDDDEREEKKSEAGATPVADTMALKDVPQPPQLIHGVPTMLSELSQVKITQVSAHPLGSHVLLISEAGLLYSYGLNDFGQLGLGKTTSLSSPQCGFIMTPTIVTPLIENGGKAIACAAGVSHSLVAVMTEERRLIRSQTSPVGGMSSSHHASLNNMPDPATENSLRAHHQLYGFGRNDYMKIGLVSPKVSKKSASKGGDEMESVKLPRRVALRCRVPHHLHKQNSQQHPNAPPAGIFAIAASDDHSAALVHRSSGDIELYSWGNAMHGALGLPQQPISGLDSLHGQVNMSPAVRVVPVPSFVASLSRSSNPDAQASSLLLRHHGEYPASVSLGRGSTFVTTSMGRAFSFGYSEDGMLGLGESVTDMPQPQEILLPAGETFASVSAGSSHTVALSSSGSIYTWGLPKQNSNNSPPPPTAPATASGTNSVNAGADGGASVDSGGRTNESSTAAFPPPAALWIPTKMQPPTPDNQVRRASGGRWKKVEAVCAGYDSSAFVVDTGHVLSCGKSSGRLGLGEVEAEDDVVVPRPVFGGLRLWFSSAQPLQNARSKQNQRSPHSKNVSTNGNTTSGADQRKAPPGLPRPSPLVRGSTFG